MKAENWRLVKSKIAIATVKNAYGCHELFNQLSPGFFNSFIEIPVKITQFPHLVNFTVKNV